MTIDIAPSHIDPRDVELHELRGELTELRARLDRLEPHGGRRLDDGTRSTAVAAEQPTRRRFFAKALTAGAAGAAGLVVTSQPAAAAPGDEVVLGQPNLSNIQTDIVGLGIPAGSVALGVGTDTGRAAIAAVGGPGGISIDTAGDGGGTGLRATTMTGTAIEAVAFDGGTAVTATTDDNTAIEATTTGVNVPAIVATADGIGVKGTGFAGVEGIGDGGPASGTVGVRGISPDGFGVDGVGFTGVRGTGTGTGVNGTSDAGTAVSANTQTGTGVNATSDTGVAGRFQSTSNVGGRFVGGRAAIEMVPMAFGGAPTTGQHFRGDTLVDNQGELWLCTASGTPGTFRRVSTPGLQTLPKPQRAYDSRPGQSPSSGTKGPLVAAGNRTVDLKTETDVPGSASAALLNVTITGTTGGGFVAVFSAAVADLTPATATFSSVNSSASGQTVANGVTTALSNGAIKIYGSRPCHVIVDVVGFYG